jgi:hypothetical protein
MCVWNDLVESLENSFCLFNLDWMIEKSHEEAENVKEGKNYKLDLSEIDYTTGC